MGQSHADAFKRAALLYKLPMEPVLYMLAEQNDVLAAEKAQKFGFVHSTGDCGFFNDPHLPYSWRCEKKLAGTGALGDLGAHTISIAQYLAGSLQSVCTQGQTFFPERMVAAHDAGYGSKVDLNNPVWKKVENEDQVQSLVKFVSGAGGVIEASRITAGKVFGCSWEINGTEGTIILDGERFNELKVFSQKHPKKERGFKTIYAGSQVAQYNAFFGFDFAGGGLGYFDVKVIEVHDLIAGIASGKGCYRTLNSDTRTSVRFMRWNSL
ncbi:hypothetical protein CHS0354_002082 [Potamilus streckersoni]|uniref:GFO/IDH/MocA-like oxidoreductase domain-containing protein n=1 Tax=Potamilus streckersoni TaxID=2493646 RepID=A0AAE0W7S9_9BIVA|nr:hypothetical protein CHS0354_002082 [Potamilus streckersoni]